MARPSANRPGIAPSGVLAHAQSGDYPDSSDTVVVPVLAWLRTHQPDAFTNPDKREDAFKFEAEILPHDTVDISVKLQLSGSGTVKVDGRGYQVEHHPEPINADDDPATWRPA